MDKYTTWIAKVIQLCGDDWNYYNEWYSFNAAWVSGMTPEQAVKDCKEWMEA